jgi:hypothetical protein
MCDERTYPPTLNRDGEVADLLRALAGLDKLPWATIFASVLLMIVAIVGGMVVFTEALNFDTYAKALSDLAVGLGLVAVGRGITKAGAHVGKDAVSR